LRGEYHVEGVYATNKIEKYLRKEDVMALSQQIMDAYDEDSAYSDVIPESDRIDLSWLIELTGEARVRLLHSRYDINK
jgi:hypothetical protein